MGEEKYDGFQDSSQRLKQALGGGGLMLWSVQNGRETKMVQW